MQDPLTGRTGEGARGMAISLLTYANRAKVAEALTAGGYPVTRVTVNRWARGGEMPGIAAQMILELFGHAADTTKEPPPEWAGAMESRIVGELERNRELIEALAPDDIRRAASRVIARLEALGPPDGEAPNETDEAEDPGVGGPPGPAPESRRGPGHA